ncbi:MAG: YhbY family RNA-binding protein [Christensenellales bacterium]|jgi:RNA-binding protein
MLTSKQRAGLRAMAHGCDSLLYIGKDGITETVVRQAEDALKNNELIKVTVQKAAPLETREACDTLCEKIGADPVQCIGRRFVLFRQAEDPEKRKIDLKKWR